MLDWNSLQVLSLLYINDITDICFFNFAISADNTNFYSKSDQTFDLWQELELASELDL